jgi:transcriptional regulator with XRE-family HTH domain
MQSRLRELRVKFGLDKTTMAALCGTTPGQWEAWEHGLQLLAPETIKEVADRFGVSLAWLGGADEPIWGRRLLELRTSLQDAVANLSGPKLMELVSATTGERIAFVVEQMQAMAPSLLTLECVACWLGLSPGSLELIMKGRLDPGSPVVARASDWSGIPERWFRLGPVELLADDGTEDE